MTNLPQRHAKVSPAPQGKCVKKESAKSHAKQARCCATALASISKPARNTAELVQKPVLLGKSAKTERALRLAPRRLRRAQGLVSIRAPIPNTAGLAAKPASKMAERFVRRAFAVCLVAWEQLLAMELVSRSSPIACIAGLVETLVAKMSLVQTANARSFAPQGNNNVRANAAIHNPIPNIADLAEKTVHQAKSVRVVCAKSPVSLVWRIAAALAST